MKKEENISHSQEKLEMEIDSKMNQMLKLSGKGFKAALTLIHMT